MTVAQATIANIADFRGTKTITTVTEVKPSAKHSHVTLVKQVTTKVRIGYTMDEMDPTTESGDLPWGEWVDFPRIIAHKDKQYLRVYPFSTSANVIYTVNGNEVGRETFKTYLTPSAAAKVGSNTPPKCLTLNVDSIVAID